MFSQLANEETEFQATQEQTLHHHHYSSLIRGCLLNFNGLDRVVVREVVKEEDREEERESYNLEDVFQKTVFTS